MCFRTAVSENKENVPDFCHLYLTSKKEFTDLRKQQTVVLKGTLNTASEIPIGTTALHRSSDYCPLFEDGQVRIVTTTRSTRENKETKKHKGILKSD